MKLFWLLLSVLMAGVSFGASKDIVAPVASRFAQANLDKSAAPDFQKHVVPLLGKLGCSSAKCHGSFQGQGGFRLSLFGFDFQQDHAALTAKASSGKQNRVNLKSPDQSLMLLKATKSVKHKGGEIIEPDSWEYRLLHRWIESGALGTAIHESERVRLKKQPEFSAEGIQFFEKNIRPLLEANCYECHGFNERKGGLQLNSRSDALGGGASDEPAIVPGEPDKSLLITAIRHTDPDLQMPPKRKLEPKEIADLEDWVRMGGPWPVGSGAMPIKSGEKLVGLDYEPKELLFQNKDDTGQIRIIARWGNGEREDVTDLTRFLTKDDTVVKVDETGLAQSTGKGDTHIVALYDNGIAAIPVLRPLTDNLPQLDVAKYTNPIDRFVTAKLIKLGITPSKTCTDAEFLRRLSIDLTGTLPSPDEVKVFLADKSKDKRNRKIQELLKRPAYAAWWTNKLCDFTGCNPASISSLLEVATEEGYRKASQWYDWIYQKISRNASYADLAEGIILADPARGVGQGMPYFWTRQSLKEPKDTAMSMAHSFLGIQLQCAECHKHPFDQWTQNDFVDFAGFFDPSVFNAGRRRENSGNITGKTTELSLLRSRMVKLEGNDPRRPIMQWLRQKDNPWFARSFVNRVWAGYFNVGIVEPTDEFTPSNPPSNPQLLNWLTEQFIKSNYDMKWLHRQITSSLAYQRSWRPNETNAEDRRNYSRAIPRRIPAEVIYDAMKQVTAASDKLDAVRTNLERRGTGHLSMRMAGTHAMKVFGKPGRATNCDCERVNEPTLLQSIFLQNDPLVRMRLSESGWVNELVEKRAKDKKKMIREAWLRAFNRYPSVSEETRAMKHLQEAKSIADGMRDLLWALMNSKEFILNR